MIDHGEYFIIRAVVEMKVEEKEFDRRTGAIGIDINVEHIVSCKTDKHANCIQLMPLKGKKTYHKECSKASRKACEQGVRELKKISLVSYRLDHS